MNMKKTKRKKLRKVVKVMHPKNNNKVMENSNKEREEKKKEMC